MTDRVSESSLILFKQISFSTEKSVKSQNRRPEVRGPDVSELCISSGINDQASKEPQTFKLHKAELDDEESANKLCTFPTQSKHFVVYEDYREDQCESDKGEDQSGEFASNKKKQLIFYI